MRMLVDKTEITVDLIRTVVDIGQLSALAAKLGFSAIVEPNPDRDVEGYRVRFIRTDETWGEEEIMNLAVLHAYTAGRSGDDVLLSLRQELARRHFPMDKPIQDVMEIGGGIEHEGHDG